MTESQDNSDWPYTDEVKKHLYEAKGRLPVDFPLSTEVLEDFCIVISIDARHFNWRTVEDRLSIALELERLKTAIRGTGISCLIDKPKVETRG